jgi:hypothetical protein
MGVAAATVPFIAPSQKPSGVRKATLIGRGSVSVGSAAVRLAGQIFDTLGDKTVLLMGRGRWPDCPRASFMRAAWRT